MSTRSIVQGSFVEAGGSEFAGHSQRCIEWVRDCLAMTGKIAAERDGLRALVEAFVAVEGSGPPKRWPAVQALIDWLEAHPEGDNGERYLAVKGA